jgi:hypothetical protein
MGNNDGLLPHVNYLSIEKRIRTKELLNDVN